LNPSIREKEANNVTSHNQCGVTKCNINNIYNSLRSRSDDAHNTTGEKKTQTHTNRYIKTKCHNCVQILGSNRRQLQT
jgi:hypothetical protein